MLHIKIHANFLSLNMDPKSVENFESKLLSTVYLPLKVSQYFGYFPLTFLTSEYHSSSKNKALGCSIFWLIISIIIIIVSFSIFIVFFIYTDEVFKESALFSTKAK